MDKKQNHFTLVGVWLNNSIISIPILISLYYISLSLGFGNRHNFNWNPLSSCKYLEGSNPRSVNPSPFLLANTPDGGIEWNVSNKSFSTFQTNLDWKRNKPRSGGGGDVWLIVWFVVTMRRLHLYCLVHIVITVKTLQYKPVQIFFWDSVHFFLIEMHSCGLQCKIHIFAGNIVEHVQFTLQCSDVRGADGILVGTWRLAFCQNETKRSSSSSSSYSFCNLGQRWTEQYIYQVVGSWDMSNYSNVNRIANIIMITKSIDIIVPIIITRKGGRPFSLSRL